MRPCPSGRAPGHDGWKYLALVRTRLRCLSLTLLILMRVLVRTTGYGQPADRVRSREAGFDEHLVKPVDAAALIAVIHRTEPSRNSSDGNGDGNCK
jgi:two-component system CheB/CheR fusion protein